METFGRKEDITYRYHRHKHRREQGDEETPRLPPTLFVQEHRPSPQGEGSEGLVCPREIAPHDVEVHEHHPEDAGEERQGYHQPFADGTLVKMQKVCHDKPRGAQCCIARGDRSEDNAQHCQDTTHRAEPRA